MISRDNNEKLVSYICGSTNARGEAAGFVVASRSFEIPAYGVMTEKTYILGDYTSLHTGAYLPQARIPLPPPEQADLIARVLPPELAFLAANGFSREPLLNAVVAASRAILPVDHLLSEGKITEEIYYRALANHLGCQYYCGYPPFAHAFDAVKGLRCGVAPLQSSGASPRMVIAPRAQFVSRLIEATQSGAIRSGSFAVVAPKRFASLVRAYHSPELLDVALGRLPRNLTAREGMTGLQIAAAGVTAILALFLGLADFVVLHAVASAILWLIFSASVMLRSMAAVASDPEIHSPELGDDELPDYTIVVALYREASVVEDLVKSIDAFDYPKGKLDIKLVIEQRDVETLARIVELRLPARYEIVVAPSGSPQTKPRALNIALSCARGELLVVYDAEDIPAPINCALRRLVSPPTKNSTASRAVSLSGIMANRGFPDFSQLSTQSCSTLSIRACVRLTYRFHSAELEPLPCPVLGRDWSLGRVERHRGRGPRNSPGALRLYGAGAGFGHLGGSSL